MALGSISTYYGNRDLQEDQSTATARGIARVLSSQFEGAETRIAYSLKKNRLILPTPISEVFLSTQDEQLLASALNFNSWTLVSGTLYALQGEKQLTDPELGNQAVLEARAGLTVPIPKPIEEYELDTAQRA